MNIRIDHANETVTIDGIMLSLSVLKRIVNPDNRVLIRFRRQGNKLQAIPYSERDIIWLDPPEMIHTAELKEPQ